MELNLHLVPFLPLPPPPSPSPPLGFISSWTVLEALEVGPRSLGHRPPAARLSASPLAHWVLPACPGYLDLIYFLPPGQPCRVLTPLPRSAPWKRNSSSKAKSCKTPRTSATRYLTPPPASLLAPGSSCQCLPPGATADPNGASRAGQRPAASGGAREVRCLSRRLRQAHRDGT